MKKEKLIDIIFWCWILFGMIAGISKLLIEANISLSMLISMVKEDTNLMWPVLGTILLVFLLQFIQNGIITIGYITYKVVMRKHKKERIEKIDLKNDEYYREKISKYSVAVLSYVDDFEISENDIAATILALKLKKCIEISEDKITILNENLELSSNEKYILECLKRNLKVSLPEFQKCVTKDALDSNLIEAKMEIGKKLFNSILLGIGSFILGMVLLGLLIANGEIIENISTDFGTALFYIYIVFIIICFAGFPALIWWRFFMYIGIKLKDPYLRSREGKEINKKLEGLRKYISDFSLMEEKEKEAIEVWEEYLVYSVVFGINKKISEDILRMIDIY